MLGVMKTLMQRCRAAGLAVAVLASGSAVQADDAPETPSEKKPTPTRTTIHVVSTEAGGTGPTPPAPPQAPAAQPPSASKPASPPTASAPAAPKPPQTSADLPPLPPADAPADPSAPAPSAANDPAASSEPPAPSEYDQAADMDPAALEDFREVLAPYGTWTEHASFGVVWTPHSTVVGVDFAPYVTHGHWGLTATNSWLWISDFSWGWAPFHYGRWVWIGGMGWGWIPGRVYSPAWVVWRTGYYDDYYIGWAPMPPTWYWRRGWAYRLGFVPPAPYVFCSSSYVFAPHVRPHIAPPARVNLIAPRTRPYVAASPSVVSAPTPMTLTRGPSPVDGAIPAAALPTQRVSHDPRALSYARTQTPSRSFAAPQQQGGFAGRDDFVARPRTIPSSPGSSVYTTRPSTTTQPRLPGPEAYTPRPLPPYGPTARPPQTYTPRALPPSEPMFRPPMTSRPLPPTQPSYRPPMPTMPRPAPFEPSIPRSYSPPSTPFARPSPAQMVRPSAPAPVFRPPPPAANVGRPSMAAPRTVAPPAMRPVAPRISR